MARAQAGGALAPQPAGKRQASGSDQARCWPATFNLKLAQNLRLGSGSRVHIEGAMRTVTLITDK